jgi:hypothetical protein
MHFIAKTLILITQTRTYMRCGFSIYRVNSIDDSAVKLNEDETMTGTLSHGEHFED